ncbi:MAG TPA: hypothetical protein VK466_14255 [Terriglobales bacterium]|nr:hypothetical protein [Terriglobales bacterium]
MNLHTSALVRNIKEKFVTRFAKYFSSLLAVGIVSCMTLPVVAQSPGDIRITTNAELAVPGHLLEPGTYWVRRAMANEQSFYRISDADGRFIAYMEVIPTQRTQGNDTEVEVSNPDAAGVRVLQAWYSAGNNNGYEVVYSKGDIRKLDQIAEMRTQSSGAAGQH